MPRGRGRTRWPRPRAPAPGAPSCGAAALGRAQPMGSDRRRASSHPPRPEVVAHPPGAARAPGAAPDRGCPSSSGSACCSWPSAAWRSIPPPSGPTIREADVRLYLLGLLVFYLTFIFRSLRWQKLLATSATASVRASACPASAARRDHPAQLVRQLPGPRPPGRRVPRLPAQAGRRGVVLRRPSAPSSPSASST